MATVRRILTFAVLAATAWGGCSDDDSLTGGSTTGGSRSEICAVGTSSGEVQAPVHIANLRGQTSWFASPIVADLDGDNRNELIAAYYSLYVYDEDLELIAEGDEGDGRVYAPHVVADLDRDDVMEIVVGHGHNVKGVDRSHMYEKITNYFIDNL